MGVIFTKDLVLIDPEDGIPVKTLLTVFNRKFLVTGCGAQLREARLGSERKIKRFLLLPPTDALATQNRAVKYSVGRLKNTGGTQAR